MIVKESINFERGLDPKTSMDVGKSHLDRKILEETDWAIDIDKHGFIYEIIELIRNYKGYPILVLRNKQHESWPYRAISVRGAFGDYQLTPEKALDQVKKMIDGQLNPMRESINFERGMDPKQSMGIGRTVHILLAGEGKSEGFKALVLDPVDDPKVNPGKTIFWVQALEGENKGEKIIVRKFDEPFGKYWGLEWSLALGESVNFERGLDPMRSMDIGMFHFDVEFSGDIEDMEDDEKRMAKKWNYKGIKILHVEGNADEDSSELFFKLSDGDEILFKQKSYMGPSRPDRADYAKISISSLNVNDFEVHDAWLDELSNGSIILATMRMYEDIKNQNPVNESINFERGMEPKKSMGIGLTALEKRIIEETDWHEDLEGVLQVAEIEKVILDYMDSPIVILKLDPNKFAVGQEPYLGISKFSRTDLVETAEIAEHDAKIDIENHYIRERDLKKMSLK